MWTIKPAPIPVQFLRERTGTGTGGIHRKLCNFQAKSQSSESFGGLGQQILLQATDSNQSKPVVKEKEISGSDVLWAMQRATAQRKRVNAGKRKKTKTTGVEVLSSTFESTGDNGVDYSNVTPLKINNDWGQRLEELEMCLKEFEDTAV